MNYRAAALALILLCVPGCGLFGQFGEGRHMGAVKLVAEAGIVYEQLQIEGLPPEQTTQLKARLYDLMLEIIFPPDEAEGPGPRD